MTYKPASWMLTSATDPIRATLPDIGTMEEVESAKIRILGLRDYPVACIDHPISNNAEQQLRAKADEVLEQAVRLLRSPQRARSERE